jgi:hypothetical protein
MKSENLPKSLGKVMEFATQSKIKYQVFPKNGLRRIPPHIP